MATGPGGPGRPGGSGGGRSAGRLGALIGSAGARMAPEIDRAHRAAPRPAGAGRTPCCRKIPATVPAIHASPRAEGCRPSGACGNRQPDASGSMMITRGSAAVAPVSIAWSVR